MAIVGAQSLPIGRKPHGRLDILGHREEKVAISVVFDLSDGPFMAVQHQGSLNQQHNITKELRYTLNKYHSQS
jgi:hypothetical protein